MTGDDGICSQAHGTCCCANLGETEFIYLHPWIVFFSFLSFPHIARPPPGPEPPPWNCEIGLGDDATAQSFSYVPLQGGVQVDPPKVEIHLLWR